MVYSQKEMTAPGKVALTTLSYMNIQGTRWDKDYTKSTIFLRVITHHACKMFEVALPLYYKAELQYIAKVLVANSLQHM